jgi:hypothetical protein
MQLPNWGTTLDNSAKCENLPRFGTHFNTIGARIQSLESKGVTASGASNSFLNFGSSLGGGGGGPVWVPQTEFKQAKMEIQKAFLDVNKAIKILEQGGLGLLAQAEVCFLLWTCKTR